MRHSLFLAIILVFIVLVASCLPPPDDFYNPVVFLSFEVEDSVVSDVFLVGFDFNASSGKFLYQPPSVSNTNVAGVSASHAFSLSSSDNFSLWVRMFGVSSSEDAAYAGINGDMKRIYPSNIGVYEWVLVGKWNLSSGVNSIDFGHGESNTRLDMAIITNTVLSIVDLDDYVNATIIPPSSTPICGNGILEDNEECDNSTSNGIECNPPIGGSCTYCSNDCKIITLTNASEPVQPPWEVREKLSLRGDPDFNPDSLSIEARTWYDRFWYAVNNDRAYPNATAYASSDDLYDYARGLNQHMLGLFTAFRATGDLKILDEIDRLAELMRLELYDGWCDNLEEKDRYLNWRYRRYEGSTLYCKDIHVMEEMLTHGHVAQIAYAYHINKDLASPGGINYSERANFWTDYLEKHFEAKWRERNRVEWPKMNFLTRTLTHPHMQFFRYHYYMFKITEKEEYRKYAESLTDTMIDSQRVMNSESGGFLEVQTPLGTGIIWAHRPHGWSTVAENAQPFTYIRYTIGSISDLAFENFYRFDDELMDKIGVSVAYFVMDTDPITSSSLPFASSIIGDNQLVTESWSINSFGDRGNNDRYAISTYTWPMPFMKEGVAYDKMRKITLQSYNAIESDQDRPRRNILPAIMLADTVMRNK